MQACFTGGQIYRNGRFVTEDLFVDGVRIVAESAADVSRFDVSGCYIVPGFADVHVHLREPGFSYKETIRSGTLSGARGGYTAVCAMANLSPVPDNYPHLKEQLDIIKRDAVIRVYPYGAITVGEKGEQLADLEAMAPYVAGFSDDGKGVQSDEMMAEAMRRAKALGKVIVAHCEDEALLSGSCIHKGAYAKAHGFDGISSESEWRQVERDLKLAAKIGCAYHVCHVSTKESVALIRAAKAAGVDVTCETGPHYLLLDENDLEDHGRFKMNPPLREAADREALVEGLCDGTIDMIATDHAPHSAEEKSKGLRGSLMGVSGLEAALPVLWTNLVKTGILAPETLIERMCLAPRKRFSLTGGTEVGQEADFCVIDPNASFVIEGERFLSGGKFTPFEGWQVTANVVMTVVDGNIVWQEKEKR